MVQAGNENLDLRVELPARTANSDARPPGRLVERMPGGTLCQGASERGR